ncbi:sodium:proton antiporter [Candidatus Peregrinibacteria bacterium]|nr:MAG: sodium:proton antiporter [Candidatus Peregrinibacteria bacterium]
MDHQDFFFTALSLLIFLFVGGVLHLMSGKIRIPFTMLLVLFGMLISFFGNWGVDFLMNLQGISQEDFTLQFLEHIGNFRLSPDIVFFIFLPILVFESSFNLRFSYLKQNLVAISVLSIFSVLVSAGIISFVLHSFFGISWLTAIAFGIIISATDPVAVLGTFKEVGAPRRLRTIVEGESLFNDGTTLVLFKIVLGVILLRVGQESEIQSFYTGIGDFFFKVFGGVLFGVFMGFFFSKTIEKVRENQNVEMTFALILAHSTFLFAEHIGVSGIIATVMAGVILGNYGRNKITPSILATMESLWDHMAFIVNSFVFILIGIAVATSSSSEFWFPSFMAVIIVTIARFLSVIPALSLINLFTKRDRIPFSWQVIIAHGGLRGALAVVMLLLIPRDYQDLQLLQAMTVSVIIAYFIFNSTTISWVLRKFGLMNFTPIDILEIEESHVLVSHSMRDHLKKIYRKRYVSEDVYHKLSSTYRKSETKANKKIKRLFQEKKTFSEHELLSILKKHCLGVERKVFYQLFSSEEISEQTLGELIRSTERQKERITLNTEQEKRRSVIPFLDRLKDEENRIISVFRFFIETTFFRKMIGRWKRNRIIQKYERYRARRISAWNVLKHLEELEENGLFLEGDILQIVREQYQKWHKNAQEKQFSLEKRCSDFLKGHKFYLTKRNCLALEQQFIQDFFERDIVTQKVYMALQESLQRRMKKIRKDATEDEDEL